MALDGIFLHKLKCELYDLIGSHIDKIYQPSKDELVFLLRSKAGARRLLISTVIGNHRLAITSQKPENPESPPMFCMLLRKYLGAARLMDITQTGYERILNLVFSSTNEMGDSVYLTLVCEMISNRPNVILCDSNGRIIDALKHSSLESSQRIIHTGAPYSLPEKSQKLLLGEDSISEISEKILSFKSFSLSKAILNTLEGFSPLVSNEIAFRVCGDFDKSVDSLSKKDILSLNKALEDFSNEITSSKTAYLISDGKSIRDFCFTKITHFGYGLQSLLQQSFSEALDLFYTKKDNLARIKKEGADIIKLVNSLYAKTSKRLLLRQKDLKGCANRENLRIYGELIKANLYRINKGVSFAELENYYDENLATVTVKLDPALSPSQNADRYFKEYKKTFSAERTLTALIENDKKDIVYLESVLDSISRCESVEEIREIREELKTAGFIKTAPDTKKQKKAQLSQPLEFTSPTGFKILVGKNNRQNDMLTLNIASKNDLWFHTKNIPGSHVIVFCDGKEVDEQTLKAAAGLAAYYSKARESSQVPIDYTSVKYVKKPSGAKPGMVIYTTNKTIFAKPQKTL